MLNKKRKFIIRSAWSKSETGLRSYSWSEARRCPFWSATGVKNTLWLANDSHDGSSSGIKINLYDPNQRKISVSGLESQPWSESFYLLR